MSLSSGNSGFPDELLFLLSFVSLLLLLSLLFTVLAFAFEDGPPPAPVLDDDDDEAEDAELAGSFLMIFVGGEPSSCFMDVTINCSDVPKIVEIFILL